MVKEPQPSWVTDVPNWLREKTIQVPILISMYYNEIVKKWEKSSATMAKFI